MQCGGCSCPSVCMPVTRRVNSSSRCNTWRGIHIDSIPELSRQKASHDYGEKPHLKDMGTYNTYTLLPLFNESTRTLLCPSLCFSHSIHTHTDIHSYIHTGEYTSQDTRFWSSRIGYSWKIIKKKRIRTTYYEILKRSVTGRACMSRSISLIVNRTDTYPARPPPCPPFRIVCLSNVESPEYSHVSTTIERKCKERR